MRKKRTPKILAGYTHHNKVRLVHGGHEYFSRLKDLIDRARTTIHLQTYIFTEDETGRMVANALMDAARRQVSVFVLLDGYASQDLSKPFIRELKQSGVRFRWFWPLFRSRHFYLGRRMHHKILVTDASYGLTGGVNISDKYNDIGDAKGWLDWGIYVEGEAALRLHVICNDMWRKAYWKTGVNADVIPWMPGITAGEECMVRVRRNDWVQRKAEISRSYLQMFRYASHRITIMSSYFLPGELFRRKMAQASKRGVKIRIIMGAVSDVKVARLAERYMYRWLFRNGIEIYEYQETVLHGKIAVYDGLWATVGSYNVNRISAYASVELNLDVRNKAFAGGVQEELDAIIRKHCVRVTPESFFSHNNLWHKILQRLAYQLIRVLFFLFTFYFRQENELSAVTRPHKPRSSRGRAAGAVNRP
ncbi:MAG: phospholipase D-like domain-containing protein [Bacteroidota bacterium]|nr:phospholipase D-like domain-containing protein [Bacteroidota bacterium]MDP4214765.1 phospholipase D-like domain-containing protein [Bacteroidota bacterium]MDP4245667.1 phospholipase D-like domain-containing protein [Bacteroidota bacterium]MDP4253421.1 phospholipase D-like domain-containing protein [Bacteroidota bacterium]MDP4256856.1 phospholipase D-like domain-containing protein [Bacteroidota bacterium]